MTLTLVDGNLGSGKTLLLVKTALEYPSDKRIFANFHIDLPNVTLIRPSDLADIEHGLVLLDEMYLWLDSRRSGSNENIRMSHDIFKSRKRGLDIWGTVQLSGSVDLRFRTLVDKAFYAAGLRQKKYRYRYFVYNWQHFGYRTQGEYIIPLPYAEKYLFPIYDTNEFPEDTYEELDNSDSLNEQVSTAAACILEQYGPQAKKLTKAMVEDWLWEAGEKEIPCEKVYARVKREAIVS